MQIVIGNVKDRAHFAGKRTEYVGRFKGVLGNPFLVGRDGSRDEVVVKYRRWLWKEMQVRSLVWEKLCELARVQEELVLLCHCAPLRCHAEVVRDAVQWLRTQSVSEFVQ
jgi:hypothetical protein